MNARTSLLTLTILSAAYPAAWAGQPADADAISINSTPSRWRLGAGYAPLLGLDVDFKGLGNFRTGIQAPPTGGGVDYDYDDGFVHLDSSGNAGGKTWNWGYENAGQLDPANGGSISYTLTSSVANAGVGENNEAESGVECYGYYDMGAVGISGLKEHGATWGFRGGLHYARVNVENQSTLASATTTQTDRYNLDGVIAPLAPYSGSFNGPGPLISDSPNRSVAAGPQALIDGARELDVHLTTLSFGSYLEIPVCHHFNVTLEGGLNAGIASGSYDFQSATAITGLGTRNSSGSDSDTTVLPGVYLGLSGIYQLNESWAIQAAGRYQYMDHFDLEANGSTANLSFDSAFVVSLGVLYSF